MKQFVKLCKETPKVMGSNKIKPTINELNALKFRRSIFVTSNISKGEKITKKNIGILRPSSGMPIKNYHKMLGKIVDKNYKPGDIIKNYEK